MKPQRLLTEVPDSADIKMHLPPAIAELRAAAPVVLPSLLQCDFGRLADEVGVLEAGGARALHLDVMDGHFVPNLTYGLPLVETFRRLTRLPLDVHLMIDNPAAFIERFRAAGADVMTVHVEAVEQPGPLLRQIRDLGAAAGLALNPSTPLSAIEPYLDDCDVVLVMSVMPGFGGQKFDPVALEKLRCLRDQARDGLILEIDGGIHEQTIGPAAAAGAHWFVAGSAVFGARDHAAEIHRLTELASGA